MEAAHDLNLYEIVGRVARDQRGALMIMAVNRVIRPVSMDLVEEWYEDSYITTIYVADTSSAALSRAMIACGKMNLNHASLKEIIKANGISGALYYDLTSYSSQSKNMEFLEYGYSRSDPDHPQVNDLNPGYRYSMTSIPDLSMTPPPSETLWKCLDRPA